MDEAFIEAYFQIDKNMKGIITRDQLENYQKVNGYDHSFVTKWMNLFDRKRSNIITLTEFCEVLGLDFNSVMESQRNKTKSESMSEIQVIAVDMEESLQKQIIALAKEAKDQNTNDRDLVKNLKLDLDRNFGRLWHVMLIQGQYWSYYSHEPRFNFVFKMGNQIFVTWKVPSP